MAMGRTDNQYSSHLQILKLALFRKRRTGFVSDSWPVLYTTISHQSGNQSSLL